MDDDVAELYSAHGGTLVRAARGMLRSDVDAEDAVQDAMLSLLRAPHLLSVIEEAGAWLYTVVRRRCVDLLRRERVRRSDERESALRDLFDETPDARERLERQELVAAVADALKRLDEPLRFAFVENALEGKTFKELSAESGLPMGTLMARKQRAVDAIRGELRRRGLMSDIDGKEKER